jgi:hypothetical protein
MTVSYDNEYEYAHAKLSGSIVRYRGDPVTVLGVNQEEGAAIKNHVTQLCTCVPLEELDLTPVPLGYMNLGNGANYLTRIPHRSWKQGVRSGSISTFSKYACNFSVEGVELTNTILGRYPKLEKCFELLVCGEVRARAFTRLFSLGTPGKKGFSLFYKDLWVGRMDPLKSKSVDFNSEYEYLTELLEEALDAKRQEAM